MKRVMRSYCRTCDDHRPFEKHGASNILHLLLSIVTAGIWFPIWILCILSAALQSYRCRTCGESQWLRHSDPDSAPGTLNLLPLIATLTICLAALVGFYLTG